MALLHGFSDRPGEPGVRGDSAQFNGVLGISTATGHSGVAGVNDDGNGAGVYGRSARGAGVHGQSAGLNGVLGITTADGHSGVAGVSDKGSSYGVYGRSQNSAGVVGTSTKWVGVYGETVGIENGPAGVWGEHKGAGVGIKAVSKDGVGLAAYSTTNEAIHAETRSPAVAAIAGYNLNDNGTGAAIYGKKTGTKGHAGFFDGDVHVTRTLTAAADIVLSNADCAEDFDIADTVSAEPGTVMVLGEQGMLHQCSEAYDKRVAGVISGAGDYKPGIVLDKRPSESDRRPIALLGKVYCKVDAGYAAIEVGDLLTTSPTAGHAMKVDDPVRAFGAVLGKALRPVSSGQALIPVLVTLQ
jgi:hypothetical protein